MERKASKAERQQGLDLADYLIRFDYRTFTLRETEPRKPEGLKLNTVEVAEVLSFWDQLDQGHNYDVEIVV